MIEYLRVFERSANAFPGFDLKFKVSIARLIKQARSVFTPMS